MRKCLLASLFIIISIIFIEANCLSYNGKRGYRGFYLDMTLEEVKKVVEKGSYSLKQAESLFYPHEKKERLNRYIIQHKEKESSEDIISSIDITFRTPEERKGAFFTPKVIEIEYLYNVEKTWNIPPYIFAEKLVNIFGDYNFQIYGPWGMNYMNVTYTLWEDEKSYILLGSGDGTHLLMIIDRSLDHPAIEVVKDYRHIDLTPVKVVTY